jgi:hypothetical protein
LYEKEASDSAEDLRAVIEAQERDADRLENVRACCDGNSTPPPPAKWILMVGHRQT